MMLRRARELEEMTVACRRDLHRYPESGFLEFRTMSVIYHTLLSLGYEVRYGESVTDTRAILGLPPKERIEREKARAIAEGADEKLISALPDGCTGIVAVINGTKGGSGRTVAFRFDMDANELSESHETAHRPFAEGFSSLHESTMHACGHDGHIAIGLTAARLIAENRAAFSGRVKLIFQPAEEGVRGAHAMTAAGVADDVDFFFSGHIGISALRSGTLYTSAGGFMCAAKYDVEFLGGSAHAALRPEQGRNALLAAAQAALSLHGISRHGEGASRVNVGVLNAGSGRNIIPEHALLQFELRGENESVIEYMKERSAAIIRSAADIYAVDHCMDCVGASGTFLPDPGLAHELAMIAEESGIFSEVYEYGEMKASEDCTELMNRVVCSGGKATYFLFGSALSAPHHTPRFDFDEKTLTDAAAFLAMLAVKYAGCR